MTILRLGNAAPVHTIKTADGTNVRTPRPELGNQITTVEFPDGARQADASALALSTNNDRTLLRIARDLKGDDKDFALALRDVEDLWWGAHSDDAPEWVESDDDAFATVAAAYFSLGDHKCVVGRPEDWRTSADLPPIGGGSGPWMPAEFSHDFQQRWREENLLTSAGVDAMLGQMFGTAAQPAAFNYMAVTANSTAPASGDTTLTAEITTAGGGLVRGQATYAHTTSTNTATLTRTLTANGSDALPVTLAKIGIFNASSAGTLGVTTLLNATATLSASGDNVTVTDTITRS